MVGSESRGWNYSDHPDEAYLLPPKSDIHCGEYRPIQLLQGITIEVPDSIPLYANIYALDDYMLENGDVAVWPGNEYHIAVDEES